jgi:type II secretory pathway pseudopilin PulG
MIVGQNSARACRSAGIWTWDGLPIRPTGCARRSGITLTEILIAIMILGVGMVSIASLFPLGLLRLRDATRYTRSAYLTESAQPDATARALFNANSFPIADSYNIPNGFAPWWFNVNNNPAEWNPLASDTAIYGDYPTDQNGQYGQGATSITAGGAGLPFIYDPLWRYQTPGGSGVPTGYYIGDALEARFGAGLGFIRTDPTGGLPSAHGLQRITNFNGPFRVNGNGATIPLMPQAAQVPNIFVSPEDVVMQEPTNNTYTVNGVVGGTPVGVPSPIVPDLSLAAFRGGTGNDWRYSWAYTGYQVSGTGGSTFDGYVVIFENRPFGISAPASIPNAPPQPFQAYQVDGETVVEAIFGHGANIQSFYAAGADRTVLLRWYASQADPVVRPGDWIADVTYERQQTVALTRFFQPNGPPYIGYPNPFNNFEWDNTPPQRCYWYQVQKITQAIDDPYTAAAGPPLMRSMVVYVDRTMQSRTMLQSVGTPVYFNAALICPSVVNVFQQQITVR